MPGFKYAHGGKLYMGRVDLAAQSEKTVPITGPGVGGGLARGDYAVLGLPLAQAVETVQIVTAADNQTYECTIRGRRFVINSGAGATVGSIRTALRALVTAAASSLGTTDANVGGDSFSVTSLEPGRALDLTATAQTPANIAVSSRSLNTAAGNVGVVEKKSGQIKIRANAAITASFDLAIVG